MMNNSSSRLALVRGRCHEVYEYVANGKSSHWTLHTDNLSNVRLHIEKLIQRDYDNDLNRIPMHSRLRHHPHLSEFEDVYGVERVVMDMLVVSCLLDAGAGDEWAYTTASEEGISIGRSEGIARAVQDAFLRDPEFGHASKLQSLTLRNLKDVFQVSLTNPMNGLENRLAILHKLSHELESNEVFASTKRPSAFVDYLRKQNGGDDELWEKVVMQGFARVYPKRDEWLHSELNISVPFFKLQQWLTYPLLDALQTFFPDLTLSTNIADMTALAEYRNGGLFVDHQVLKAKYEFKGPLDMDSDAVIEWRACTVILCDELLKEMGKLTLPQLLEAGTWKAGREMAALIRPTTKSSPVPLNLDGTIF